MHSRRFRHLLLLAHVWACMPFALVWLLVPDRIMAANPHVVTLVSRYLGAIAIYLAARTLLAWHDPRWLAWETIFPILDVVLISIGLYLRKDPDSVLTLVYFFAIAEAAGTLNVLWAACVGLLCVAGAILALSQRPHRSRSPSSEAWIIRPCVISWLPYPGKSGLCRYEIRTAD